MTNGDVVHVQFVGHDQPRPTSTPFPVHTYRNTGADHLWDDPDCPGGRHPSYHLNQKRRHSWLSRSRKISLRSPVRSTGRIQKRQPIGPNGSVRETPIS